MIERLNAEPVEEFRGFKSLVEGISAKEEDIRIKGKSSELFQKGLLDLLYVAENPEEEFNFPIFFTWNNFLLELYRHASQPYVNRGLDAEDVVGFVFTLFSTSSRTFPFLIALRTCFTSLCNIK